jgi:hypothetical protein
MPKKFPMPPHTQTYMTYIGSHLGNTPNLKRIIPIIHHETLSKPELLNYITYFSICLGKGGFHVDVWVILLLVVIEISMIPVTYEPREGVPAIVVGLFLVDRYK